jgi:hypothetical protein
MASFSKSKIIELVEINQHRGNFSYSISIYNIKTKQLNNIIKDLGVFDINMIPDNLDPSDYIICHVQAPTGGILKDTDRIHPTKINDTYLYHNGIIKPQGQRYITNNFDIDIATNFDTYLLHSVLPDYKKLSEIEGLFACLYVNNTIKLFRTRHAKLYIDDDMSISSEEFKDSKCINYDTIYELNLEDKKLLEIDEFKTKRYNIIIQGDL